MEAPLVSIIVPVYNTEPFIEETIQSILAQDYDSIELILVNDGSTDNSGEICESYASNYSSIQYCEQANAGVSVARNKGLDLARGTFVYFMDADDTIDVSYIRTSVAALQRDNAEMVLIGTDYCHRLPNVMALPTCAAMFRRDFLMKYPRVRFPEGIQPCEDGLFIHRLLALTNGLAVNRAGKYHYRKHDQQNHVKINANCERVLNQIPRWITILTEFYEQYSLQKSHALHLALFMQHEPFELRYLSMPLNSEQKDRLLTLIQNFMNERVVQYLTKEDYNLLSLPFQQLLKAASSQEFDTYYLKAMQRKKLLWKLTKLMPIMYFKRRFRKNINTKYGI